MYVRELYMSVQLVYNNAMFVTVLSYGCGTAICILRIIHLLYGAQQDVIICLHSLRLSYTNVCQAAVYIPIKCSRKCGLHHIGHLGVGQCHFPF